MSTATSCICQSFGTEEGCWQAFPGIPQATWLSSGEQVILSLDFMTLTRFPLYTTLCDSEPSFARAFCKLALRKVTFSISRAGEGHLSLISAGLKWRVFFFLCSCQMPR